MFSNKEPRPYEKLVKVMQKGISFGMGIGCIILSNFFFLFDDILFKMVAVCFFIIGTIFIILIRID